MQSAVISGKCLFIILSPSHLLVFHGRWIWFVLERWFLSVTTQLIFWCKFLRGQYFSKSNISSDVGKILRYEQFETALTICFAGVLFVWVATRLVYYPFWIIRSVWFDAPALIQDDYEWLNFDQQPQAPRFIMLLLTALLILHIFWAYILFKVKNWMQLC